MCLCQFTVFSTLCFVTLSLKDEVHLARTFWRCCHDDACVASRWCARECHAEMTDCCWTGSPSVLERGTRTETNLGARQKARIFVPGFDCDLSDHQFLTSPPVSR